MCLSFLITGTGTVRWRAEGAGLGSQRELSPEIMSPPRTRRRRRRSWLGKRADTTYHIPECTVPVFYTLLRLTVHTGFKSRRLLTLFFDHTDRAVDEIQATNLYTTKLCTTGMLFTPKAYQGSEKSTVDLSFSLSYFSKEVEVRDKVPVTFLRLSVRLSVITGCVCQI